uniref:Uncharacterized protein n=1 Tax=Rhizophora mucronata TaxID=61149 RepID=A0A2P2PSC5_RHIMU
MLRWFSFLRKKKNVLVRQLVDAIDCTPLLSIEGIESGFGLSSSGSASLLLLLIGFISIFVHFF